MVVILFSDLLDVYLNSESQFAELINNDKNDKEMGPQMTEEPRVTNPESERKQLTGWLFSLWFLSIYHDNNNINHDCSLNIS